MSDVTITTGDKVRTWGGWYRHDIVRLNGIEIGRIQVRRRNGRIDTLTCDKMNACVTGSNVAWLLDRSNLFFATTGRA